MIPAASQLLQYIVSGLTLGSIYGMIALGFTLIHNATGIVNFAQGEFVTLGALIAISGSEAGLPMPLAVLGAVVAVTLVGAALERTAIRPARNSSVITLIIITIGASILLRGVAMWLWAPDPLPMRHFTGETPIRVGDVSVLPQHLWIIGIVLVTMTALRLLAEKTQVGKAMRACAMNREAAQLMGIPVERMVCLSFALSGGLGGLEGAPSNRVTGEICYDGPADRAVVFGEGANERSWSHGTGPIDYYVIERGNELVAPDSIDWVPSTDAAYVDFSTGSCPRDNYAYSVLPVYDTGWRGVPSFDVSIDPEPSPPSGITAQWIGSDVQSHVFHGHNHPRA